MTGPIPLEIDAILASLRDFQRASVEDAFRSLYLDEKPALRFHSLLLADETRRIWDQFHLQSSVSLEDVHLPKLDDRLPEAVRRLDIDATVIEVTRREGSLVDTRRSKDPVSRYLDDASALAKTDDLPPDIARRVIGVGTGEQRVDGSVPHWHRSERGAEGRMATEVAGDG